MVKNITKWYVLLPYLKDYERHLLLSDFEKELRIAHQTIKRYIKRLLNENILKQEKKKRHTIYSLNLENPITYDYLSISEKLKTLNKLKKSTLLKRLYEFVSPFFLKNSFLIFGSFAKNLEGEDIDLLIIGKNKQIRNKLKEFSETYDIKIHKIPLNDLKEINKTLAKEILKNHIILNNSDLFVTFFGGKTWKK